jgi:hypothetical protein
MFLGDYSLGRRGTLGHRLLAVPLIETIDSARRVNEFLFASKERMTSRADFYMQVALAGRARLKRLATGTGNGYLSVFGVDSRFHCFFPRLLSIVGNRPRSQTGYHRGPDRISSSRGL